jgi:hypothetical protein
MLSLEVAASSYGRIGSMTIFDIYSKRQQRTAGNPIDVFEYDKIPFELRTQIIHILRDVIGPTPSEHGAYRIYNSIHDALAREYGTERLGDGQLKGDMLFNFVRNVSNAPPVLDTIEIAFAIVAEVYGNPHRRVLVMSVTEAAKELNQRFLEAGVGYQYENGQMMRVDSQFLHAEVVKPALVLLSDSRYHGSQEEFLKAHKDYREGDYKGCLTECLKAFESTLKTICEIRKWSYSKTDTARTLIDVCLKNNLIPSMLQAQLNALQTVLESGVPTLRNRMSGHGQGAVSTTVPPHVAAYALQLAATNIVLLASSEKASP